LAETKSRFSGIIQVVQVMQVMQSCGRAVLQFCSFAVLRFCKLHGYEGFARSLTPSRLDALTPHAFSYYSPFL
jgi:hypothetical protein